MTAEFTITEDEYVRANLLFTKPARKVVLVFIAGALALLIVAAATSSELTRAIAVGAVAGVLLGHLGSRFGIGPWATRRQYRALAAATERVRLTCTPEGIRLSSASGHSDLDWSRIRSWRHDDEFVLVYQAPAVYHVIPKRIGAVADSVVEGLNANVGAAT